MADGLTLDLRASLNWLLQDTLGLATVSDSSRLEYSKTLNDGLGPGQADVIWHDRRTVLAGDHDDLDLTALMQTLFGASFSTSIAKVKALLLVSLTSAVGAELLIGAAAVHPFAAPFSGDGSAQLVLAPDSAVLLINSGQGWDVTPGSATTLGVHNVSVNDVTYAVVVAGTSA